MKSNLVKKYFRRRKDFKFILGNAMSVLFLPKFSSDVCGIYPFEISRQTQISSMSRSDLHRILGDVPENLSIRCVILFSRREQKQLVDCLKTLLNYYSSDVVILGGFIDKIRSKKGENSPSNTCGFVFTGDRKHFDVRQVILGTQIRKREEIREKLNELKTENFTQSKYSFAIQISCVARGAEFYDNEKNVECSEFRRLFPQTPLIGIFGNGELGHEYLPEKGSKLSKFSSIDDELFHSYSTVYSLFSIFI